MRRRKFLGSVAIAAISGCVEGVSGGEKTEKSEISDRTEGVAGTQRPEKSEITETSDRNGSEARRVAQQQQRSGGLEVSLVSWRGERSLRYHDGDADALKRLDPTGSWWLQPRVRVSNIGSQAAELPGISDFSALTPTEWSPVDEFEKIDRSSLRQPSDGNIYTVTLQGDHVADGEIKPGDVVTYLPLFDVGELEELSLAWETQGETKYLATDVVHLSD